MDPTKKRKIDDNGTGLQSDAIPTGADQFPKLTPDDARKILESFSRDQMLEILQSAILRNNDVLNSVRSIADRDTAQRKLFIRGLGWDTTTEGLKALFSTYGELEEGVVIVDKATGKSKGYGFVTFKHVDGALLALKEPSKKIDGRVTVTQLAAAGAAGNAGTGNVGTVDVSLRKIFVGNVPFDMDASKLLSAFQMFGEIEEGPLGFDKQTGKSKGFALFVYKTPEGAQAALVEKEKIIDGRQVSCKLAIEGRKNRQSGGEMGGGGDGMQGQGQYGVGPGGGYNGNAGGGYQGQNPMGHHPGMNAPYMPPGPGGVGAVGVGGAGGGYNLGGSHYPGGLGYGGAGGGTSMYGRMPPNTGGAGGYPEAGSHWPNSGFPNQAHQPTGNSPAPRVPPGGMYGSMPPYY